MSDEKLIKLIGLFYLKILTDQNIDGLDKYNIEHIITNTKKLLSLLHNYNYKKPNKNIDLTKYLDYEIFIYEIKNDFQLIYKFEDYDIGYDDNYYYKIDYIFNIGNIIFNITVIDVEDTLEYNDFVSINDPDEILNNIYNDINKLSNIEISLEELKYLLSNTLTQIKLEKI